MFGFLNLICCIFFFWSLKHFESQSQSAAIILVPITPSVSIANEMAITLCTIDASICSIYYTYIFGQKSPTNTLCTIKQIENNSEEYQRSDLIKIQMLNL
uniref:Uncharacterized protein n=1 Tax=Meloidogyne enterolobii TaxID=390850 RepID=A0A6V7V8T6_MELEN|nr:unnamed protein product [Meloidogyne enterolobii]